MAWTSSATQRRSSVLGLALARGQQTTFNALKLRGKSDSTRAALVAFAMFATVAGAAVPHLDQDVLTAILFLSGAAAALMASATLGGGHIQHFTDITLEHERAAPNTGSVPAIAAVQFIPELFNRTQRPGADLATWARLTSRMSHELRTPLNAVLGFSELMSAEVFGPLGASQYADYAHDIHASGRQLLKSAEDALVITSLLTAPERQPGDAAASPAASASEAIAFHALELRSSKIETRISIPEDIRVVIEAQTLRQIMINLVAEAAAIAAPGTTLEIGFLDRNGEIELRVALDCRLPQAAGRNDSFALLLARTLTELAGSRLTVVSRDCGTWVAQAKFQTVSQTGFVWN
jgi:signal transduction histidine kinase